MKRLGIILGFIIFCVLPAKAQNISGYVVATCGTISPLYIAGRSGAYTVDVNGVLCSSASGGGGGGAITAASGSYASGALSSGSMVDLGSQADSACSTDNGSCSAIALIKRTNQDLTTLNTTAGSPLVAGSALVGKFGIDQTTPGTTNAVQANIASGGVASGAFASGAFAAGSFANATAADPCLFAAKTNVSISMQNTTTVKLVSLASSQKIYICSLSLIASGATVFSIADGTKVSTECDTAAEAVIGTTVASHGLSLAANGGVTFGSGNSTVALTNTAAHDLCLFQSGSVDLSGNMTYVQRVP